MGLTPRGRAEIRCIEWKMARGAAQVERVKFVKDVANWLDFVLVAGW